MKKLALALTTCILSLNVQAQYADIGVHAGFGTTWLINNNVSDQDSKLDPEFSTAPTFGFHVDYSISRTLGLKTEFNYAVVNQKYKGVLPGNINWKSKDRINYIEVPLLLLLKSRTFYCEIGPKFSMLAGAKSERSDSRPGTFYNYTDQRDMSSYQHLVVSAVLGLGGKFNLGKGWNMNAGLRFSWGLSDATRDFTDNLLNAPDNVSTSTEAAHFDQSGNIDYEKTHIATGQLIIGISRRFPY